LGSRSKRISVNLEASLVCIAGSRTSRIYRKIFTHPERERDRDRNRDKDRQRDTQREKQRRDRGERRRKGKWRKKEGGQELENQKDIYWLCS
jgi:Ni/Co efflux regulator RcnB